MSFELANSVQDAFVIAVEEQAKVRLQRLLALQRVKPVDMSQLSMQLNNQTKGNNLSSVQQPDFSFLREGSPIYVTSLSGQNVTACSTKTTDSSVAFKPALISQIPQQYINTTSSILSPAIQHTSELNAPIEAITSVSAVKTQTTTTTPFTPVPQMINDHKTLATVGALLSSSSSGSVGSKTLNNNDIVSTTTALTSAASNGTGAHPQTSFDSFFGNSSKSSLVPAPHPTVTTTSSVQPAQLQVNGHTLCGAVGREPLTTLAEVDYEPPTANEVVCPSIASTSVASVQISTGGAEVLLGDQSLRQDNRPRRRSGSSIVVLGGDDSKDNFPNDVGDFISGLNYAPVQQQHMYPTDGNMDILSKINPDNGHYQEMAVDVPDSFIARNKTPPRYPPPQPQQPPNHLHSQLNSSVRPVPPPRDHLRIEQDGRLVNRAPAPQVPERNHPQHGGVVLGSSTLDILSGASPIAQVLAPTIEQLDTIQKYKDLLRRRHEDHNRVTQEDEFMRVSLRESRKLQALQNHRPPIGVENSAFLDDDMGMPAEIQFDESTSTFDDVQAAIVQLHYELNKSGFTGPANRIAMVQQLLASHDFAQALALREQVLQRRRTRNHNPVNLGAQELAKECVDSLVESNSPLAIELCDILSSYEMEGLMLTHDAIANDTDSTVDPNPMRRGAVSDSRGKKLQQKQQHQQNYNQLNQQQHQTAAQNVIMINNNTTAASAAAAMNHNKLPAVYQTGDVNDPIRIIQIEKSSEPLGATILNEGEAVVIGRIVRGGAAEKSGLLHEHDEILEVNGIEMSGRNVNDVCALLAAMSGTLTFLIVPAAATIAVAGTMPQVGSAVPGVTTLCGPGMMGIGGAREPSVLHVRAHFDYDPEDDRYIPCRELGISFQKGDVLHVISREDSNWWQAYREGEEDQTLAGLIPSQSFQHQREAMRLAAAGEASLVLGGRSGGTGGVVGAGGVKGSTLLCMRKAGRKGKKRIKASSEVGYPLYATTTPDDPDPEEILTYEEVALYYPRESHKRPIVLIGPPNIGRHELRQRLIADSDRFAAAMPHTSRARRDNEMDYHFISRVQFEADILSRKFVEHGEYERAYYGTSLDAIRTVVSSGKICVLNLHPQSLKLLRASDLKPYVVLVAPPSLEKLRQKKERNSEPVKDDDLKEIIATARDMEARWGHLFDMIIINNDTERAYHQLLAEINSLEREPQWVPASWVH